MKGWHHSPEHRIKANGAYIITGGTRGKSHFFRSHSSLDYLQELLFQLVEKYRLGLKAWSLFSNHYHLIVLSYENSLPLNKFINHFHSGSARELNISQDTPGRKVWYQYWDTRITFRNSYYARLNYVMQNPVKHGLVKDAKFYPWCSAKWFAENTDPGHYKTITSFQVDEVSIVDDF